MAAGECPADLLYHPSHDWVRIEGDTATFGVTWYAQDLLGEVVFWDGPEPGAKLVAGRPYAELESVKAISDVVAALSGEVVEVNKLLTAEPALVNTAPYGDGWLVRVRLTDPDERAELLDAAAYEALVG